MTKLRWHTIKFSLTGVRGFELHKAAIDFQNLLSSLSYLRNVKVSLMPSNTILIQADSQDLANLENEKVGERATEQMLETLSAVLIEPWDVTVQVIEVKAAD